MKIKREPQFMEVPSGMDVTDPNESLFADPKFRLFAIVARNAFDVMMRRGWYPVLQPWGKWIVCSLPETYPDGNVILRAMRELGRDSSEESPVHAWADPFTALVEADTWYRDNVEKR